MTPARSISIFAAFAAQVAFAADQGDGPVVEAGVPKLEHPSVETGLPLDDTQRLAMSDPAQAESNFLTEAYEKQQAEIQHLREQLAQAEESRRVLTESLAIANAEAELFKRQYRDLKLRMEALGLESANPDRRGLEQRLLQAVSDLRIEREEAEKLRDQLVRLAEAMLPYLAASTVENAELRAAVEAQMRQAAELAYPMPDAPARDTATLTDARVLSVKDEWSLVVGNLGEREGVKIGMPFRVTRSGETIADLVVVEVRDRVFGAVVQNMAESKTINVGDKLQVAVQ